jgi:hypothetical protein
MTAGYGSGDHELIGGIQQGSDLSQACPGEVAVVIAVEAHQRSTLQPQQIRQRVLIDHRPMPGAGVERWPPICSHIGLWCPSSRGAVWYDILVEPRGQVVKAMAWRNQNVRGPQRATASHACQNGQATDYAAPSVGSMPCWRKTARSRSSSALTWPSSWARGRRSVAVVAHSLSLLALPAISSFSLSRSAAAVS